MEEIKVLLSTLELVWKNCGTYDRMKTLALVWENVPLQVVRKAVVDESTSDDTDVVPDGENSRAAIGGGAAHAAPKPAALTKAAALRIGQELRNWSKNPHPSWDVYPTDDMGFWRCVMVGPANTP